MLAGVATVHSVSFLGNGSLGTHAGHKMTSTDALLAVLLGNLILALMGLVLGMIGCREGGVPGMYCEG